MTRKLTRAALAAVGLIATGIGTGMAAAPAHAQTYPDRPITWVVPFGPGTVTDNSARVVAKALGDKIGQSVIIENKPGAAGIVGTEYAMNAKPDGYTFLYASSGPMAINPSLYPKLSYSPLKSFTPVNAMSGSPLIMVVNASSKFKTLKEFVDYAKANPEKINFGTSGAGTTQHLTGELLQLAADFKMTHIPYKTGGSQMADLLGGNIDVSFEYPSVVRSHIEAGKLRPLGITSAQRLKNAANIPTFVEQGWPQVQVTAWSAIVLPANAPADVTEKLGSAFRDALKDPAVVAYFDSNDSISLADIGPKELPGFIESEIAKFKPLVEKSGARVD
ncbi:tripartite tricarboxylate transporter substrate binding protein [Bradyrhizobium sp. LHD-71]|uniref:Bug family tripartite tricarboxylate transporter substrate binding protein n=1 Tax=Bradyrhizobium sp. LHD-71 TaxID=3072141 RepID=UPI00280DB341|nr:tripartite tricarboxylate transporter substrate binding protein [Bradyrhizobium sp. LHD-71]MDQ8729942.1 tripartite tricarboxylate transporter substrate binding protein [Bradyrhizobium sp. LHD-71]